MPICHNSACTSIFFKNINLKPKWTTSHFHSAPKTLERQLLNQNIALQFFLPFSSSGHLLMLTLLVFACAILSFNLPPSLVIYKPCFYDFTESEDSQHQSNMFITQRREHKRGKRRLSVKQRCCSRHFELQIDIGSK